MSVRFTLLSSVCLRSMNLTWRDMQHLVVRTSQPGHLSAIDWKTNGVGRRGRSWLSPKQAQMVLLYVALYLFLCPEQTMGHSEHRTGFFVCTWLMFGGEFIIIFVCCSMHILSMITYLVVASEKESETPKEKFLFFIVWFLLQHLLFLQALNQNTSGALYTCVHTWKTCFH